MAIILILILKNEAETQQFGQKLARCTQNINSAVVIYLEGDLGTGKTTLARGFIQNFGFNQVKSPTYSIVESYKNALINIHHFDCYRLSSPTDLDYIGIRDYLDDNPIQLIEWAKLGKGVIPPADMKITLSGFNKQRKMLITVHTKIGKKLLRCT